MQRPVGIENFDGLVERMSDKSPDCMVHEPLGFIAELPRMPASRWRRANPRLPLALIRDVAKLLIHSVSQHHATCDIGSFNQIVGGTGRKML